FQNIETIPPMSSAWSSVGSGAAVDEDSRTKVTFNDFAAALVAGQTGTGNLRYNITAAKGITYMCPAAQSVINVRFRNSDTADVHTHVTFDIHRTNISTGGNQIIASFTSTGLPGSGNFQTATLTPNVDFDFTNNIYWVEATLFRDNSALFADLGSIEIFE